MLHRDLTEDRYRMLCSRTSSKKLISDGFLITSWFDEDSGSRSPRLVRVAYDVKGPSGLNGTFYEAARIELTPSSGWFYRVVLPPGSRTGFVGDEPVASSGLSGMTHAMFVADSYLELYCVAPREFHRSLGSEFSGEYIVPCLSHPVRSWKLLTWLRRHPLTRSTSRSYLNRHVRLWALDSAGSEPDLSHEGSVPLISLSSSSSGSVGAIVTEVSSSVFEWSVRLHQEIPSSKNRGTALTEKEAFLSCDAALRSLGCSSSPYVSDLFLR